MFYKFLLILDIHTPTFKHTSTFLILFYHFFKIFNINKMALLLNIIVIFIFLLLGGISIYMYTILSDTRLTDKEQNTKISPISNWVLGIGITIVVLIIILTGIILVNPSLSSIYKTFGTIIGLLFGAGIFLIIIGWQLKAIETSNLTDKQKNTKYVGFTITIVAISGFITGASIGFFANSLKIPGMSVPCKPVPCIKPVESVKAGKKLF
jgi:hypothetical protein